MIYSLAIPEIKVCPGLDFLLLELPPRYMPFMPSGIGYVHNILKRCGVSFQTIDANIIFYHRWHSERVVKGTAPVLSSGGYIMKEDPWDTSNTMEWGRPEVIDYFWPQLEEIIDDIARNRPKAVGISLSGDNIGLIKRFVAARRVKCPPVVIVAGGYVCLFHDVGPFIFPDFDYMVIREAEGILEPLATALSKGERPKDMTGILSKYDSPSRTWKRPPPFKALDSIDFPKYDWADLSLYKDYKGDHLIPIVGSRGCNWGRCNFCCEHYFFRKRSPRKIADEIEYFTSKGFNMFHFNESDVNGDSQNLHSLCSEIIKRGIKAKFFGQLRIKKTNTREYFNHLAMAGFVHLRFGVDGWSESTLRLERKGYNMKIVFENLRDCHESGIRTTVNIVLGVPGEKEENIDEMADNLIRCKNFIDKIESLNIINLLAGSEYYNNPDKHNIRFKGDRTEIYKNHINFILPELWYSEKPHIDHKIRLKRLDKLCVKLSENGFNVGSFARESIKKILGPRAGNIFSSDISEPELIEENYRGFNILLYGDKYYGLAQDEGAFNIHKLNNNRYRKCMSGKTIGEVKAIVDHHYDQASFDPRLVEEGRGGFNILFYDGKYYGLAQREGAFDINRFNNNEYKKCLTGKTADEVRERIHKKVWRLWK